MRKDELRPCRAWNEAKRIYEDGWFHGFFQYYETDEYGSDAGVVAVFENKYGETMRVSNVVFTDREEKPNIIDSKWQ